MARDPSLLFGLYVECDLIIICEYVWTIHFQYASVYPLQVQNNCTLHASPTAYVFYLMSNVIKKSFVVMGGIQITKMQLCYFGL